MSSPADGPQRLVRASAFGVAGVGLALTAHVAAGGRAPSAGVLAALGLLAALTSVLFTGRRRGPVAIAVALTAMQATLHEAFMATAGAASMGTALARPCPASAAAGLHAAGGLMQCGARLPGTGSPMPMSTPSSTMLLAHLAATLALAGVLAFGERALWALASWLLHRPDARHQVWPTVRRERRVRPDLVPAVVRSLTSGGVGRRGPPVGRPAATA